MGKLNIKRINSYFALFLISCFSIVAQSIEATNDSDIITKSFTIINSNDGSYESDRNTYNKDPLAFYTIDFSRVFNKDKKVIGMYESLIDFKPSLADGEYYKVIGLDNNEYLFDGSFLIQFKLPPDFNLYASDNNLIFLTDLSDINVGIFKNQNIYDLQKTFIQLKEDDNIEAIQLNLYHSKTNQ